MFIFLLVSSDRLVEDPNHKIVAVTIHNETGSLNRILKAFRVRYKTINRNPPEHNYYQLCYTLAV